MVVGCVRATMSVWTVWHILGFSEVAPFGPSEDRFLVQSCFVVCRNFFSFISKEVNQCLEPQINKEGRRQKE